MQQVTNIKEIETAINETGDVVITKNEKNNVIMMSLEEYDKKIMKKNIIEKLKQAEKEIENGEEIEADVFFKEMRQKYGY